MILIGLGKTCINEFHETVCFHSFSALSNAVFSRERFTMVTAYRDFVTKSQLLETLLTQN